MTLPAHLRAEGRLPAGVAGVREDFEFAIVEGATAGCLRGLRRLRAEGGLPAGVAKAAGGRHIKLD